MSLEATRIYLPIGVGYQHVACKASTLSAHLIMRMLHLSDFGMQRTVPVKFKDKIDWLTNYRGWKNKQHQDEARSNAAPVNIS